MRGVLLSGVVALALAGCCSSQCEPEALPHGGLAATPAALGSFVRYAAAHECWGVLYGLMSRRTRAEVTELSFKIFFAGQTLPDSLGPGLAGEPIEKVLREGRYLGYRGGERDGYLILYYKGRQLLARVVLEPGEPGAEAWRVALKEQLDAQGPWVSDR